MTPAVEQIPDRPLVKAAAISWPAVAWFAALLIAAYFPILRRLVNQWMTDEDVSHGFFVPLVSLYIAWQMREKILSIDRVSAWWGLGVMAWGALQGTSA